MKKGKYANKGMRKSVALLLTMVLLLGVAIGGTVAWLTSQTDTVVNTFTTSNIGATLTETTGETYKMIPGWTIDKDPKASVTEGSEDSILYVQITESANFDDFMTYEIADGWTVVDATKYPNVYYRIFEDDDAANTNEKGKAYSILKDDKVKVLDTVTKEDMDGLTADTYPTLSFKAYAIQLDQSNTAEFAPLAGWETLNPPATP